MSIRKKIYLSSPHMCGEEEKLVKEAFDTNWIAPLGPHIEAFEREISEYVGVSSAVALSSGTAAIHMALKYLGVTKEDTVFCSALTFVASCNPIVYEGAEPIFIDSDPSNWNMSPIALEKAFIASAKEGRIPKAVVVVNLYGQSADLNPIMQICNRYKVPIIEDAAESLGTTYYGKYSGTLGYFGTYSFNGNKIITTSGGGMLVSNDMDAIKKVRFWATQAKDNARHYEHSEMGYNYRMSNVLAAIGRGQLKALSERIGQKKHIYETYKAGFSEIKAIKLMPVADFGEPNYWLSVLTVEEKSIIRPLDIMMKLERHNIESRPVWKPMQLQPLYAKNKFFPHTDEKQSACEDIFERGVCLPSDTKLTDEELQQILELVKELFI